MNRTAFNIIIIKQTSFLFKNIKSLTIKYFPEFPVKEVILGYVFICCRRNALLQIDTPFKPSLLGSDVITLHQVGGCSNKSTSEKMVEARQAS